MPLKQLSNGVKITCIEAIFKYSFEYDKQNKLIYLGTKVEGEGITIDILNLTGGGHSFSYDKTGNLVRIYTSPACACPDFYKTILNYNEKGRLFSSITYWYFDDPKEEYLMSKSEIIYKF